MLKCKKMEFGEGVFPGGLVHSSLFQYLCCDQKECIVHDVSHFVRSGHLQIAPWRH
jgi:hypothetical protein